MTDLGKIGKVLNIKFYNNFLKVLLLTNTNRILLLEMIIDTQSFSIELNTNFINTEENKKGKAILNLIEDKEHSLFKITDITDKIFDKFLSESEEN